MLVVDKGRVEHAIERASPGEVIPTELFDRRGQIVTAVPLMLTINMEPFWPITS